MTDASMDGAVEGGPGASSSLPTYSGELGPATKLVERGERVCAIEQENRIWCWDIGDSTASLVACTSQAVEQVSFDGETRCPACARDQAGRVSCWTRDTHHSFLLTVPVAADVQADNAVVGAIAYGRCAAVVLSTKGELFQVALNTDDGLATDVDPLVLDMRLPPARSDVMHRGSVCASLKDGRVWCDLELDANPIRTHTVGEPPSDPIVPELRGAKDLSIDDLCVSGTLADGRRRKVCIATMTSEMEYLNVRYHRVVRDLAPRAEALVARCRIEANGSVVCRGPEKGPVTIQRGKTFAEQCF